MNKVSIVSELHLKLLLLYAPAVVNVAHWRCKVACDIFQSLNGPALLAHEAVHNGIMSWGLHDNRYAG